MLAGGGGTLGSMKITDQFVKQYLGLLAGGYDCLDRIVLNGYFLPGQNGGGMRQWWLRLRGDPVRTLKKYSFEKMATIFARRTREWGRRADIPVVDIPFGERKHEIAEEHLRQRLLKERDFRGVFCVLVARAPAKLWRVSHHPNGQPHLETCKQWPMVYHLHFHVLDEEWGHVCFKISVHPPFGLQVILNGHDWVERQARRQAVSMAMRGNAFVDGDLEALDRIAARLLDGADLERQLRAVCERWVYSGCLIHGLTLEEQKRSDFRYHWSFYQLEYSRNLLFKSAALLESTYQGMLDRTRRTFDIEKLKTLMGWRRRPAELLRGEMVPEKNLTRPGHDVSVWRIKCGGLGLKLYDKTERLLRVEVTAHHVKALRCGRGLDKAGQLVERMGTYTATFLDTVEAAHLRTLDDGAFDRLPNPSVRGKRRVAGVDLNKERMRRVCAAVSAVAPDPRGFSVRELAARMQAQEREPVPPVESKSTESKITESEITESKSTESKITESKSTESNAAESNQSGPRKPGSTVYNPKKAGYDLGKLRAKGLIERIEHTHRYRVKTSGLRVISGALCLRQSILPPVLAGLWQPGAPPEPGAKAHRLDKLTLRVQSALHDLLCEVGLAA